MLKTWGLMEIPTIGFMDGHHALVHMRLERDFVHGWAREGRSIDGCGFQIFRWMKDFDVRKGSSLAPQWIFLLGLPLHMYHSDVLQILATQFGRHLGSDNAMLNCMRASGACICVEVDLQEEPVKGFSISISNDEIFWQEARYEKHGYYCRNCFG